MKEQNDSKTYFQPGDLLTLRQNLENKPIMIMVEKSTKTFHFNGSNGQDHFKGIVCRWFTKTGELQEAILNTKDLIKV